MKRTIPLKEFRQDPISFTTGTISCYPYLYQFPDESPVYLINRFNDVISTEEIRNDSEPLMDQPFSYSNKNN